MVSRAPTDGTGISLAVPPTYRDLLRFNPAKAAFTKRTQVRSRASPNTVHLMILIAVEISMAGRGLARGGRSGKLLILRLTPRGLRRLRLDTTRSCRISSRTAR